MISLLRSDFLTQVTIKVHLRYAQGTLKVHSVLSVLSGTLRYAQVHLGTLKVHLGTSRYTQIHSGTFRYTQGTLNYTHVHSGTLRYTQIPSGTLRYT